ncbi:hypothetical protein E2C01_037903 [Portunus trituberculatus]|uniref:Uncharacterized protein n=1 Tax=Portunus trituberculatus TaxID=210409 RepID=A0A5B7FFU6_PORTR|nr:hypothetical protein [Portunus trituberculatus]
MAVICGSGRKCDSPIGYLDRSTADTVTCLEPTSKADGTAVQCCPVRCSLVLVLLVLVMVLVLVLVLVLLLPPPPSPPLAARYVYISETNDGRQILQATAKHGALLSATAVGIKYSVANNSMSAVK